MYTAQYAKIAPRPVRVPGPRLLAKAARLAISWYDRWIMRQELSDLDDRILRDIGLDREVVRREIEKPFWRP